MPKRTRKSTVAVAKSRQFADKRGKSQALAAISTQGIDTADKCKNMIVGLMSDVLDGNVTVGQASVLCSATGKYLAIENMRLRFERFHKQVGANRFLTA